MTFKIEDILLVDPEASPYFPYWELSDYGLELKMKLSTYREEI